MTDWVKKALTRKTIDKTATIADEVPPSERLVLGVKFAITLTFSLTAIEIAHLALLGTWNSEVFATTARANQQFHLRKLLIDQSGIGEPILEQLQQQNVPAEGETLTQDTKTEILTNLKLTMEQNRLAIPYDKRLCEQINDQQYAFSGNGKLAFTHPQGTHDDQLWALALATQAARNAQTPQLWVVAKRASKLAALRQRLQRHKTTDDTR